METGTILMTISAIFLGVILWIGACFWVATKVQDYMFCHHKDGDVVVPWLISVIGIFVVPTFVIGLFLTLF